MNVFAIDSCPARAAIAHCDQHVSKMITESVQMLSNAHFVNGGAGMVYLPAYVNHKCSVWVRESSANYDWLLRLARSLLLEHITRGGCPDHQAGLLLAYLDENRPRAFERRELTPWAQAVSKDLVVPDANHAKVVDVYRAYYRRDKPFATWSKGREAPKWMKTAGPTEPRTT